jgi:hypothetical protein
VRLAEPVESLTLFEVGVQQVGGGLRGLVDKTGITRSCRSECRHRPRTRERCQPRTRCLRKGGGSGTRHDQADHSRCHHASQGGGRSGKGGWGGKDGGSGEEGGTGKAALAKIGRWVPAPPNPCGRNDLIRMARDKAASMAELPEGLRILSRMPLAPGCGE